MYWKRCSPNATTLNTSGITLNVQLRLQLSSTKTRTPFASPRKRHRRSRARRGRSRASKRINRAFVLRSARDEALLEETLRFNRVAARTDFTLAQALSLGVFEVPMVVVAASPGKLPLDFVQAGARAACARRASSTSELEGEGAGCTRHASLMVLGLRLALMRAALVFSGRPRRGSVLHVLSAEA